MKTQLETEYENFRELRTKITSQIKTGTSSRIAVSVLVSILLQIALGEVNPKKSIGSIIEAFQELLKDL